MQLNSLEQLHSKYQSDTQEKSNDHIDLFTKNSDLTKSID